MDLISYVALFLFISGVFYICATYVIVRLYYCFEPLCCTNKVHDKNETHKHRVSEEINNV